MILTQPLHKGRRESPDATAVVCGDTRLNFGQFAERASRLGAALQALGMAPGQRIGMLSLNSHRFVEYFFGVWWGGGVVNPVNIRWNPKEIAYSLDDCDTRILLVDDTFVSMVAALRTLSTCLRTVIYCGDGPVPDGMLGYELLLAGSTPGEDAPHSADELAAIMYTGGTTGRPKGVMLTHGNLYIDALGSIAALPRTAHKPAIVITTPMFHVAGCGLSIQAVVRLAPQYVLPMFDELATLQAIESSRATETFLVPTMIRRLIEHPRFAEFDLSSLDLMVYGAAPIDVPLLEKAMQAIPRAGFAQAYGMTELAPTVALLPPRCHLPGPDRERLLRSTGKPLPMVEIRIVDAEDNEVPAGQVGEIVARGPMVMRGYWNKPNETEDALRGGWMHTGDGGYIDAQGFLYVVDRIKDMIVSGGENVYSAEVENAIAQLPEVLMSAVIGVPDDKWGERVHAVVVLRPGAALEADALIAHCRSQIAGYKSPRSVEFRDALPLSAAGKLQKFQLREPYWAGRQRRVN
ncbi:long-chain-fatty-acid--CoA ligase [Variovorax ginsengisoli]|uniref:Acyl-CoA synthetase (AMP-forming)/AMP-acid ligase II n=1 Tax=Variovorax ginsengisoli TaxID=363844 RepID=A0ABT9S9N8_9BURK|nr:long-chain-fatty-acid--CoA ligase [Variovorax ginsengisoli]MDP9901078.1 acyl-CoA synthetase (AMP-forming)/AMP-acid ligase II [Variovorax ginsengisoli]